jgi:hypothetical protein
MARRRHVDGYSAGGPWRRGTLTPDLPSKTTSPGSVSNISWILLEATHLPLRDCKILHDCAEQHSRDRLANYNLRMVVVVFGNC